MYVLMPRSHSRLGYLFCLFSCVIRVLSISFLQSGNSDGDVIDDGSDDWRLGGPTIPADSIGGGDQSSIGTSFCLMFCVGIIDGVVYLSCTCM
jgi:hypothetical protein